MRAAWTRRIGDLLALVAGRLRRWVRALRGQQLLIAEGWRAELVYESAGRRQSFGYVRDIKQGRDLQRASSRQAVAGNDG